VAWGRPDGRIVVGDVKAARLAVARIQEIRRPEPAPPGDPAREA
jgi:hypothetical protein